MGSRYWLGTLYDWNIPTSLPAGLTWAKGQLEICPTTGREHVQLIVGFAKPQRLPSVKRLTNSPKGHWEPSRSSAADDYVHKDETAVIGTRFELGAKPFRRYSATDWESIRTSAKSGELDQIPPDVYVRYYTSLCRIAADHSSPVAIERECLVFWGATGTGKSLRAWTEAGMDSYAKDPRSKWWCGYRAQCNVVMDEFRGAIDVSHLLRWLDRYPVSVETKGGSKPLAATKIWITSNISPREWYPTLDQETVLALLRRLKITHFNKDL